MRAVRNLSGAALIACAAHVAPSALAQDNTERQAGYYYPEVTSSEVFPDRLSAGQVAPAEVRVAFVTQLSAASSGSGVPKRFVIFEKGAASQKLIAVALDDEIFKTLYRARAVLAELTSQARTTPFLQDRGIATQATFLDVLNLLGFDSFTITDGETWSHQFVFERSLQSGGDDPDEPMAE